MNETKTKEHLAKRRAREAGERVAELRAEAMTIPLEKWAPPPVIRRSRAKIMRVQAPVVSQTMTSAEPPPDEVQS